MTLSASTDWPVVGHTAAVSLLRHGLTGSHLAHAYLLLGPPNIGKTTLGLAFAQALLCEDEAARATGGACGVCAGCRKVRERRHPDLRVIEPDGAAADADSSPPAEDGEAEPRAARGGGKRKAASRSQVRIETVRDMQRDLALRPYQGARRVVVISQADALNEAAENALLKTLEEPPPYALLILTAEDTDHLLPTTVSRCQQIQMGLVPAPQMAEALEARGVDAAEAERLARLSGGRVGWAITAARDPSVLQRRTAALDYVPRALNASRAERLSLAEELAKRPDALPDLLAQWQGWWRDALLTQSGCDPWVMSVDQMAVLRQVAKGRGPAELAAALRATRQAADELERNANPRLALEVLLLSWPQVGQGMG